MNRRWTLSLIGALLGLVLFGLPVAGPAPAFAQNTLNYAEQGGATWVVDGELLIQGASAGARIGKTYKVDSNASACSNSYNGKSWTAGLNNSGPWCTVAYALTQVADYDTILVKGNISEAVTAPVGTDYIKILGASGVPRAVKWTSPTAGSPMITCNGQGLEVAGFKFEATTTGSAVKLVRNTDQTVANCDSARIHDNEFWTGKTGIELSGAPHNVRIWANYFQNMRVTGGAGIYVSSQAVDVPRRAVIANNYFSGNITHLLGAFADTLITGNHLLSAAAGNSTTTKIDLRNGFNNFVSDNFLGGTYSNAGGYYAGTSDEWIGNLVAGGLTTANPS